MPSAPSAFAIMALSWAMWGCLLMWTSSEEVWRLWWMLGFYTVLMGCVLLVFWNVK